jgi:GNAT superfamily N-acetyltransferase
MSFCVNFVVRRNVLTGDSGVGATPKNLAIRVATPEDAPELARLNAAFNGVEEPPDRLAARLADPKRVETPIIAEVEGRAVGFACLRLLPSLCYDPIYAELTKLFVEESYRRRGVGRALVAYAERLARESGAKELVLLTGLGNAQGRAFYRALGYADWELAMRKRFEPWASRSLFVR